MWEHMDMAELDAHAYEKSVRIRPTSSQADRVFGPRYA